MIEVGEYVRTKKGYIGKVIKIRERIETYKNDRDKYLVDWCGKRATYISQIKDIKHSKDIIDLVQVGDYVNGKKIEKITDYGNCKRVDFNLGFINNGSVYEKDIKSILTKEQVERYSYKLEEK